MNAFVHRIDILQRTAAFSAAVCGHALGEWRASGHFALASCIRCGAELRVYFPALQPEMEGSALDDLCGERAATQRAPDENDHFYSRRLRNAAVLAVLPTPFRRQGI
jgi:hypothetical protein